jgi:hypothetical protein
MLKRCMKLNMKPLTFSTMILLTLSACGQTSNSGNQPNQRKDTVTIYKNISLETCNCTSLTMRDNKPSTSIDSCYKAVLSKYNDSLKELGFDPSTQVGQVKLSNEVIGKLYVNCPDIVKLIQKEHEVEEATKLLFKGSFVSQKKLPTGEYVVVMKDSKTRQLKTFLSTFPFNENSVKDYLPGYELTIEYEIRHNKKTNKDEYYFKESGTTSGVGAVQVGN